MVGKSQSWWESKRYTDTGRERWQKRERDTHTSTRTAPHPTDMWSTAIAVVPVQSPSREGGGSFVLSRPVAPPDATNRVLQGRKVASFFPRFVHICDVLG